VSKNNVLFDIICILQGTNYCSLIVWLIYLRQKDFRKEESWELFLFKILCEDNLKVTFPALRVYLVLMVANSSGEHLFSKMKLMKNRLRATITQDCLSNLTILSIKSDVLRVLRL